jgi:hypothetical protein
LEELGVDGYIILKGILKKQGVRLSTGFTYLKDEEIF